MLWAQTLVKFSLLLIFVFCTTPSAGVTKPAKRLFYPLKRNVKQSVLFVRLKDQKVLYSQNSQQTLIPASVTKLVTAAAALDTLTPHFQFETNFYHTGKRDGHMIKGDLVIVGSGDPLFISEKLWQLAADIRHLGIRVITGRIIIDNSIFDSELRDSSRKHSRKRSTHAYDAPLSAFAVNFNTFVIAAAPGPSVGKPGQVDMDPYPLRLVRIQNKSRTTRSGYKSSVRVSRLSGKTTGTQMMVSGNLALGSKIKKVYRSVGDPISAAGEQVRAFFNKEGIIIQGQVVAGKRPQYAKLLTKVEGYPLRRIIESLNKYSNNYVADVLVKKLGAQMTRRPGSLKDGIQVLRSFLKRKIGIKSPFILETGSGLSPENRLSAHQMIKLLAYMERRFDLFPEFLNSLPAAGYDGTLHDRFDENRGKGVVRAKTGTLTAPVSVASLAGYVRHQSHGLVAFAIIENGSPGYKQPSLYDLRKRQDKALETFLKN